jgi:ferredoxin-type protein NapF
VPEARFAALCDGCGDCRPACPERIIAAGRGGLPEVRFSGAGCSFCGACADACPTGAISRPRAEREEAAPWALKAHIGATCLSLGGVVCRLCEERCEAGAIRFRLVAGSGARVTVDLAACTGCGACQGPCPVGAVEMRPPALDQPAAMSLQGGLP